MKGVGGSRCVIYPPSRRCGNQKSVFLTGARCIYPASRSKNPEENGRDSLSSYIFMAWGADSSSMRHLSRRIYLLFTLVSGGISAQETRDSLVEEESALQISLASTAQVYECKPGPWGRVKWHHIHLEAAKWLLEYMEVPGPQTVWQFSDVPADKVRSFLQDAGVPQGTVERWMQNPRAITSGPEATTLLPTAQDVLELSPEMRKTIYQELAKHSLNDYQVAPVRILDGSVDAWLGRRVLRQELRDMLRRLVYENEGVLLFSDPSVLISAAVDQEEIREIMQLTTRIRAVMAYLEVLPEDDASALDSYWTAGFRRKDILPMLDSVASLMGGGRLGFSHLLPAEARKYLYTYPTLAMAVQGRMPDCHWTALNFLSHMPRQFHLDTRLAATELLRAYVQIESPAQFGDLVVLMQPDGRAAHSCSWLCDNLVYTKNGESASAPWIISTLEDVRVFYQSVAGIPHELRYYRRKTIEE